MKIGEFSIGMIVDAVTEVLTISGRDINAAKDVSDNTSNRFVSSIGNIDARLIIMLNLDEIVDLPEDMK